VNTGGLFGVLPGLVVHPPIPAPALHHYRGPPKDKSTYTSVNTAGWWYQTAAELAAMSAKKRAQFSHIGRIMELPGFGHHRLEVLVIRPAGKELMSSGCIRIWLNEDFPGLVVLVLIVGK